MKSISCLALSVLATTMVNAETYPIDGDGWQIEANEFEIEDYLGERALRIKGGYATLSNLSLADGLIEFDIAVSEARGFAGAVFRLQDLANYEHFYIRPHQSGNVDANQYTPVFNGVSAWQLYHGEGYGASVDYKVDAWMHIKIAYRDDQAEVFIDSDEPLLIVDDLRRESAAGSVGFGAGNFAPAHFANVQVSALPAGYRFAAVEREHPEPAAGTVMSWQVSKAFAADTLEDQLQAEHEWSEIEAENTGITNLATAKGTGDGNNAVIARLTIASDSRQVKPLAFGYSDVVTVYVNGVPVYGGTNLYQSRDYRYLGTIGLFDEAYLPLMQGQNEVWFVVSEAFGGWGIQAHFEDMSGISLQ